MKEGLPSQVLIINADDLGYDPAVTRGIVESIEKGVVSSTTLMVNTPHSEAAARDASGLAAIGLHLNLARHAPLSTGFPQALLAEGSLVEARAPDLEPALVEAEVLAQLARLEALLGRAATHVDVHKHLHRHRNVLDGLAAAARRARVPVRSLDQPMRDYLRSRGVATNDHFIGDAGAEAYWTLARLRSELERLPPEGVIEMMCHPGYAPTTLRSGYSSQREVELQTFLDPAARELIEQRGVVVGSFRAVRS